MRQTKALWGALDPLFSGSVSNTLPAVFVNFTGVVGASGRASGAINIPPFQFLKGNTINTAFVTIDANSPQGIKSISNTFTFMIN